VTGRSLRTRLLGLLVAAGTPIGLLAVTSSLWRQMPAAIAWGLGIGSLIATLVILDRGAKRFNRPLQRAANVLHALHVGDYSVRASTRGADEASGLVLSEVNALASTLQEHRQQRSEADALIYKVMNVTEVAIMSIDPQGRIELLNDSAERMLAKSSGRRDETLTGKSLHALGAGALLEGPTDAVVRDPIPVVQGRFQVRRVPFRQGGRARTLISLSPLDRPLRAEEREASHRLIRVLSHEVNNSLAPIETLVHAMVRRLERVEVESETRDLFQASLATIGDRSASLQRFMSAYAQRARLPSPQLGAVALLPLLRSVVALETRVEIDLVPAELPLVSADRDLLSQALINLVQNAADSVLQARQEGLPMQADTPDLRIECRTADAEVAIVVLDHGVGLAAGDNVFTPLFTTKKAGHGIGLVLARDIVEQHGGRLTLQNRDDHRGCIATLVLGVSQ
jgi:two-component system, NtrC family, nitrogen regulation sensor histidine kinase NtrY